MNPFTTIKTFYKPIQPAVTAKNAEILYQEVLPDPKIEDWVYCFWQLKTRRTLKQPFVYRVVSDGCIDIFLDHTYPSQNFIMGFCRKYTEFAIGDEFDYIGIRFLPAAFPFLFGINAKTLSNRFQELQHVLPHWARWISSEINPSQSFDKIVSLFNEKLKAQLHQRDLEYDPRFFNALLCILQKKGFLDTEKDLNTGLSPRQLRRIFNYYIGTTPKAFSNVVRFQHILNAKPSHQSLKESKLYYDVGFFDQAHFIKNFKTFYGVTPSEAFR